MAELPENLEWSLPVPSVQELAIQRPETVPSRYLRDEDIITATHSDANDHLLRVPLIDMTKLDSQDTTELQNLHSACKDWGIFQLINHGVGEESLKTVRKQAQEFFNLPLKEKKRWAQKPGSLEGYGQAFVTSESQKLEWSDMIFLKVLPEQKRKLEFWPQNPLQFREALESYAEDMRQVAVAITRFMTLVLKIDGKEFYSAYEEGEYDIRINLYPPCPQPERVMGANPHADISGITLLLDCGNMPGLQVLKDGNWVFVEPKHGAIVVNIGQITEIFSNGIYNAPDHRAVVNKLKERLSIVTFCYPSSSINIGPAKEYSNSGTQPLYKTVTLEEYFHAFFNRKLEDSFIDSLKI